MANRLNISSNTEWEENVGYSRAVRIDNIIEIAGTTALDGDKIIGINNPYEQTKFIIAKIEKALQEAGASLNDVIRTRMYITDISHSDQVGKAHAEYFKKIKPASTILQVAALVNPDLLVEIEVKAIVSSENTEVEIK